MSRQDFTIISIILIQIIGMLIFGSLHCDYLYDLIRFGCPSCLGILGILNLVSTDIRYWFSKPVFRKNKKFG